MDHAAEPEGKRSPPPYGCRVAASAARGEKHGIRIKQTSG